MNALADSEVPALIAIQIEALGILESAFVAIRGARLRLPSLRNPTPSSLGDGIRTKSPRNREVESLDGNGARSDRVHSLERPLVVKTDVSW